MRLRIVLGAALMTLSVSAVRAADYVIIDEVPSCVVGEDANSIRPQLLIVPPQLLLVSYPRKTGHLPRPHYRNFPARP